MRHRTVPWFLAGLAAAGAGMSAAAADADAIRQVLAGTPAWTVYIETTPDLEPGERATRAGYQFSMRGSELVGRTTALAEGFNCEFKVRVRDGGVDLHPRSRACNDRYGDDAPYTTLEYDAADSTFPFKRLNVPQKWWLSPRR